jgi:hypothetical protein
MLVYSALVSTYNTGTEQRCLIYTNSILSYSQIAAAKHVQSSNAFSAQIRDDHVK